MSSKTSKDVEGWNLNYPVIHVVSVAAMMSILLGLQTYMESTAPYARSLLTMLYYEKEWTPLQLWSYRASILAAAVAPLLFANYVDGLHAQHVCSSASKKSQCVHRKRS